MSSADWEKRLIKTGRVFYFVFLVLLSLMLFFAVPDSKFVAIFLLVIGFLSYFCLNWLQIFQKIEGPHPVIFPLYSRPSIMVAARWGMLNEVCKEKETVLEIEKLRHHLNCSRAKESD